MRIEEAGQQSSAQPLGVLQAQSGLPRAELPSNEVAGLSIITSLPNSAVEPDLCNAG